ncbi:MAG: uroporphyrinogen decarboxylase family protein [Phycisphaerales bacterium]|jgi:hypothetical protein
MNSRERLRAVLNHQPTDRLCVDFGAGGQTGIGAGAVYRLHQAILGNDGSYRVKITEPYQMLGEIDEELRQALELDVVGVDSPKNMFGFGNEGWKPFELFDGTPALVPEKFNYTVDENGDLFMYPEGDTTAPPCAKMPKNGYFWDSVPRQEPVDESRLDPAYNCEEFGLFSEEDIEYFRREVDYCYDKTDYGIYLTIPGVAFGDIALVPAPWLKNPRGIRDVEEWYISTAIRKDYVYKVFEMQCEIGLKNIEKLAEALGDKVQVVFVSGTDFGTQRAPFISTQAYRDLYKPFQKQINDKIHELTNWKVFIHSCGSIYQLIPDMIDAGFDVLNPVQCSAAEMDPVRLKKEFGDKLVFWGGGVDTQRTLPFSTPDDVYKEVRQRIDVFNNNGGFVFNSVHNIQSNVPTENIMAMFKAIKDAKNT